MEYKERIYAGVLGKLIGVYVGRPVEGWSYDKIRETFYEVDYYVNEQTDLPLIVPDDDISGTFTFWRALEDAAYSPDLTAKDIGEAWLNYIIENKTILWWGGLGRSTEHTAYIRLKDGISAPHSGSIAYNGRAIAEQVGAQIFIDTWALVNPDQPQRAAEMARKAASVSHDGIAVEAACLLAAMESMAFSEHNIDRLIDRALAYCQSAELKGLVSDVQTQCRQTSDWRTVRNWIDQNHGYDRYPGSCPMVTNHLVVLMALLMGGDDFRRSVMIAASAGWDTDCNAGNVGCLNGIRLGLSGIDAQCDMRAPVFDRMFVVNADGGGCVTDAVQETRRLVRAAAQLQNMEVTLPDARYAFEYSGSLQGWYLYPESAVRQRAVSLKNSLTLEGRAGLVLTYEGLGRNLFASACVNTFLAPEAMAQPGTSNFEVLASPALYPGQTVTARLELLAGSGVDARLFAEYYDDAGRLCKKNSPAHPLPACEPVAIRWEVPDDAGRVPYRLGLEVLCNARADGRVLLHSVDWSGAPRVFALGRAAEMSPKITPWTTDTPWLRLFMSSADRFCPDYVRTFSMSHAGENGVATIGARDWRDYEVESCLWVGQADGAGLIARAVGHRRFYAALLGRNCLSIERRENDRRSTLATCSFVPAQDHPYRLQFRVCKNRLSLLLDGVRLLDCSDEVFSAGAAGFVVDRGAILAEGFRIRSNWEE